MNTVNDLRDSDCAAFYYWPPLWIGMPPVEQGVELTPEVMNAEVVSRDLTCGVRLKVSKEGLFVFDFAQWPPGSAALSEAPLGNWEERVFARMRFMNLFLACFYTATYRTQNQTTSKLFVDYATYAAARSFVLNPGYLQSDWRQAMVIQAAGEWHVKFKPTCMTISEEVVESTADMTDAAIADDSHDAATLAELLLHSFYLHESGKYEASHITAWTIVERCLNEKWRAHLSELDDQHSTAESQEKFINSHRRQKLTGRDFTASIISEFLSLSSILPFEQYKLSCDVRQTRNDWLHELHAIDRADAAKAIRLAQFMLRSANVLDVDIPFNAIGTIPVAWVSE